MGGKGTVSRRQNESVWRRHGRGGEKEGITLTFKTESTDSFRDGTW